MPFAGFLRIASLSAIHAVPAADVTDAQVDALNAEFKKEGYNVAVINQAQFEQANTAQSQLSTANAKITELEGQVAALGNQPGHLGSKTPKEKENAAGEQEADISETDLQVQQMRKQMGLGKR